jgi:hypothetical protein
LCESFFSFHIMLVTEEILVDRSPVGRLAQLRASVSTGRAELRELEARRKQREEVLAEVASIESEASKLRAQAQAMAKRADAEEESIKTAPKQRWTDPAQSGAPDAEKLAEVVKAMRSRNTKLVALKAKVSDLSVAQVEEEALQKLQSQRQAIEKELQGCEKDLLVREKQIAKAKAQALLMRAPMVATSGDESQDAELVQAYVHRLTTLNQTTSEAKDRAQAQMIALRAEWQVWHAILSGCVRKLQARADAGDALAQQALSDPTPAPEGGAGAAGEGAAAGVPSAEPSEPSAVLRVLQRLRDLTIEAAVLGKRRRSVDTKENAAKLRLQTIQTRVREQSVALKNQLQRERRVAAALAAVEAAAAAEAAEVAETERAAAEAERAAAEADRLIAQADAVAIEAEAQAAAATKRAAPKFKSPAKPPSPVPPPPEAPRAAVAADPAVAPEAAAAAKIQAMKRGNADRAKVASMKAIRNGAGDVDPNP